MESYAIVTKNLVKRYRAKQRPVLQGLNLELHENQIIGLIGANGSGKTTFFKLCSGALDITEGTIEILGGDGVGDIRIKEEVIYSMHALPLEGYPVNVVLKCYHISYPHFDLEFARKLLDIFKIPEKKKISALSQGMKSIVHFVCALATRAKVTMLDEPFIGIDIEKRKLAYEVLLRDYMEYPRTFIISSHNLSELEGVLSEMILIDQGQVVFYEEMDAVRELLFRADGDSESISAFSDRPEVLHQSRGELSSFLIGRGSVDSSLAREAEASGLTVSRVQPEDVCVYLTSNRAGGDLECLWK
ncbi:MAG: ABC transporter ATP-binding protein [Lachnospiraceae bacterium]|nr:ABC transporter ATP-binding protein [Lachnospiraceae bacterium]